MSFVDTPFGHEVVAANRIRFRVTDYDLAATLSSGQAFRWRSGAHGWFGVLNGRGVILRATDGGLEAETVLPTDEWSWLIRYLRLQDNLEAIVASFPDDPPMRSAIESCRGLRLLRQPPWECLVGFICSATKQIVQIEQCMAGLSGRFGTEVPGFYGLPPLNNFPTAERLAKADEGELRECKLGFRAPYVAAAAREIAEGRLDLAALEELTTVEAREALIRLPGVGPKIADCVLLFAYGRQDAFPLDVWLLRALAALYFPGRRPTLARLRRFADTHFGPWAGYAQQYLFHYARRHRPDLRGRSTFKSGFSSTVSP